MFACYKTNKLIRFFTAGGKLTEPESQRMFAHIAVCPRCKKLFDQERELDHILYTVLEPYKLKKDLAPVVLARIDKQTAMQNIPIPERFTTKRVLLRPVFGIAILVLCLFLAITINFFYQQYSRQIIVHDFRGKGIFYLPPGETDWQLITPGTKLVTGSQLVTNKWSQVELRSRTGKQIWVNRDTRIEFAKDTAYALSIQKGELYIQEQKKKSPFRIKTPAGIIDPIGTSFDIQVAENGLTLVAVIVGQVQFINAAGGIIIPALFLSTAEAIQRNPPSAKSLPDPTLFTGWVDEFKEISRRTFKTREQLAKEALVFGQQYYDANDYYTAVTSFEYVVRLEPDWWQGYLGIGRSYFKLKQFTEGYKACETADKLNPNNQSIKHCLAVNLIALGRDAEALPYAEWLIAADPNDPEFSFLLGCIYFHLGKLDDAEYWFLKTLSQSPSESCRSLTERELRKVARKRAELGYR